jgi:hypothetical protein
MAQPAELAQVLERRQVLLAESARLRQQAFDQVSNLQRACSWVDTGYAVLRSLRSWWPVAAGAAGLFIGRGQGGFLKKTAKLWSFWRLARQGLELWQRFNAVPRPPPKSP